MIRAVVVSAIAGGALAVGAGGVAAQVTSGGYVTYSLSWVESTAAGVPLPSPDGILAPGEHALVRLAVSFSGQNTVASFSPPVGTFTTGTIRGYGVGFLDLIGSGQAEGTWNLDNFQFPYLGVQDPWNLTGQQGAGTAVASGARVVNIQAGQFPVTGGIGIMTTNPIEYLWLGVWTPASYAQREVTFVAAPAAISFGQHSALMLRASTSTAIGIFCDANFGQVRIRVGTSCYANCDGSTTPPVLTVADFGCFLNAFFAQNPYANCDGACPFAGCLTVQDFACFMNAFAAGCS